MKARLDTPQPLPAVPGQDCDVFDRHEVSVYACFVNSLGTQQVEHRYEGASARSTHVSDR